MRAHRRFRQVVAVCALLLVATAACHLVFRSGAPAIEQPAHAALDYSPVDLVLTSDETRALTANQTANSVTLVDLASGKIVAEAPCGDRPTNLAITPDGRRALATATFSGDLVTFDLSSDQLKQAGSLWLGFEPRGLAISPDGKLTYVALTTAACIAVVDIDRLQVLDRIAVGRWPRTLALSPDGKRLAVGCSGAGGVAIIDTVARKQLYLEDFVGLNFGQMQVTFDSSEVYFPWGVYRQTPITPANIRRGWVIASRVGRLPLDRQARREAIALDPEGRAVGDPHGLALSPDEQTLVCTASGTHELLVYRVPGLPFQDYGGPGDHINADLLKDRERFDRIPLGGWPMAVRYSKRGDQVYIANYLLNAIQVVDMANRKLTRTIALGSAPTPSLARQGEAIFYDAGRSLDQWYSCHSCHYDGHSDAVTMDTKNDGRFGNSKAVLSLRGSAETGPWFWHGTVADFDAALRQSLTDTMLGKPPTNEDVAAVAAFLKTLKLPPNPHRQSADLKEAITRGEVVFHSEKAGCARCHPAPLFTDGKKHDVGLGSKGDVYQGYNPPSLRGVFDRIVYLHDGRAKSLEEVLKGSHNPAKVTGNGELSDQEMKDLLVYLRSL
jgi:DNA-binding beta-propeller fold protein YncE